MTIYWQIPTIFFVCLFLAVFRYRLSFKYVHTTTFNGISCGRFHVNSLIMLSGRVRVENTIEILITSTFFLSWTKNSKLAK